MMTVRDARGHPCTCVGTGAGRSRSVRRTRQLRHGGEECLLSSIIIIVVIVVVIFVINGAEPAGSRIDRYLAILAIL
jgi:hypothetical protein